MRSLIGISPQIIVPEHEDIEGVVVAARLAVRELSKIGPAIVIEHDHLAIEDEALRK